MVFTRIFSILCLLNILLFSCNSSIANEPTNKPLKVDADPSTDSTIIVGAARFEEYLPDLEGKRVALVVNHTSMIDSSHLVDQLLARSVDVRLVFAPEHGFRGNADAGAHVENAIDKKTGLPIISLYGSHKMPSSTDLQEIDLVLFDIQDVGVRFYTYTSTMTYVMKACALNEKPMIVLDRPNPLGYYVDGPVLDSAYTSFVGMHPVPIVHGLTVGEYAQMINGEGWLGDGLICDLKIVPCLHYDHSKKYELPIAPSPNLPNMRSIYLYPSLCLFEGTVISVGRGTDKQFQLYGHPAIDAAFSFVPVSRQGATYPKHQNKKCFGVDLTSNATSTYATLMNIDLRYLTTTYMELSQLPDVKFFNANLFFDKLAGNGQLREQIEKGIDPDTIRESWDPYLADYKEKRKKYVLYD